MELSLPGEGTYGPSTQQRHISEFTAMGMDLNSRASPHLLCDNKHAFVVALCSKPASGRVCGSPGLSSPVLSPSRTTPSHSSRPGLFSSQVIQQSVWRSKPVTSAPLVPIDPPLSPHCRSCCWCEHVTFSVAFFFKILCCIWEKIWSKLPLAWSKRFINITFV